ncbi:hypothetical protein EMIT0P201_10091 [Pseudomonas chlororaphis]
MAGIDYVLRLPGAAQVERRQAADRAHAVEPEATTHFDFMSFRRHATASSCRSRQRERQGFR